MMNTLIRATIISLFLVINIFSTLLAQDSTSLELVGRVWFESQIWSSGDTTGGSDVWGYTAPDSEEYALIGILNGVAIVRVSDMEVIDLVQGPVNGDYYYHRDIKTYGHYAYVVSEMYGFRQGMVIIDLSPLPDSVRYVNTYTYGSDVRSHNFSIDTTTGYAYILKQNYTGFRVVSLVDPENPEEINSVSTPNIHDVYARNDTIYVAEGYAHSFSIYDLSDKGNPVLLTRVSIPGGGYVHNIWPTADGSKVMTTEETTGKTVKMWDIHDLDNVEVVGEYLGVNSLAHNVHIMGDSVYISHYKAGITVVDISDPTNLIEIARYDTYPLNDDPGFKGCWGAYPFTKNGMIFTSDIEGYLTVLQFSDSTVSIVGSSKIPESITLHQNYPNPFNPLTTIGFVLPEEAEVKLVVYDILGRRVAELVSGRVMSGTNYVKWDASDISSGFYFYRLSTTQDATFRKKVMTRKMVLVK
ncbi:MAG: choice-of-anchor B family protein [Fidelibacterota bacterium]